MFAFTVTALDLEEDMKTRNREVTTMRLARILQGIITGMLVLVILVLLFVFFIPQCLGYQPYSIQTGSMTPKYPVGSMIYVKAADFEEFQVGDVVTYRTNATTGWIVTHRITQIDKNSQSFTTQGDANNTEDGSVQFGLVVGKASGFSIPQLGRMVTQYQSGNGKTVTIIIIVALMGLSFLIDFKMKQEEEE